MTQTTKDRTCSNTQVRWKLVPVRLQPHRQIWGWLRNTWPQGHMRTSLVVMLHPHFQHMSQMVFCQGYHEIQAFPPQRAHEPLTEGIRLGTLRRRFQDPQPQVSHVLVKLLEEDTVSVMDREPIAMVGRNRFS